MGFSKLLIAYMLLSLLLLLVQAQSSNTAMAPATGLVTPGGVDCGAACAVRCSKNKRPKYCLRACGTCCYRCHCVPPGTSGNYDACPCYASLKTHGNEPKCP